jgi:hypothetical protein
MKKKIQFHSLPTMGSTLSHVVMMKQKSMSMNLPNAMFTKAKDRPTSKFHKISKTRIPKERIKLTNDKLKKKNKRQHYRDHTVFKLENWNHPSQKCQF